MTLRTFDSFKLCLKKVVVNSIKKKDNQILITINIQKRDF